MNELIFGSGRRYICRFAAAADLPALHTFYTQFFHDITPPVDLMLRWIKRAPEALAMIYRLPVEERNERGDTLIGSFKMLPLQAGAIAGVEASRLTGSNLGPEHLASGPEEAAAYYVGDVAAQDWIAKGALLGYLLRAFERVPAHLPIFARPYTCEGRRIMTGYGFMRVGELQGGPEIGQMCVLRQAADSSSKNARRLRRLGGEGDGPLTLARDADG
ncbi:MAG: hypothetical protein M3O15_05145 [Acidobacteriota bacterium]|nr:hypothetical protein [Acidobacteriota bacterium]